MKIVLDNFQFDFDLGCRILKLKHDNSPYSELNDFWDDIKPLTFAEILAIKNIEHRRVAMNCLGIERMVKEVEPELINTKTLKKKSTWINSKGELETVEYDDTYSLFRVSSDKLNNSSDKTYNKIQDCHFLKFKDTSTDRDYYLWVDLPSVYLTNNPEDKYLYEYSTGGKEKVNAIQCIAWSIKTTVPIGNIEKIIRQGDCIMVKPKDINNLLETARHLTENEYLELLVNES